jgi:hypothetical protein
VATLQIHIYISFDFRWGISLYSGAKRRAIDLVLLVSTVEEVDKKLNKTMRIIFINIAKAVKFSFIHPEPFGLKGDLVVSLKNNLVLTSEPNRNILRR